MGMVTVDQSMGGSAEIDYADFATQMVSIRYTLDEDQPFVEGTARIEPLRGRGGLANNEVAELLYLETAVSAKQREFSGGPDQDVASVLTQQGLVGINLGDAQSFDSFPLQGAEVDIETEVQGVAAGSTTDNAQLQLYQANTGMMFDDEDSSSGGGPGGNFNESLFQAEKYFRETHGRGPVLDQTDDITVAFDAQATDTVVNVEGQIDLTMYWDVAETSDAGRRFSVP